MMVIKSILYLKTGQDCMFSQLKNLLSDSPERKQLPRRKRLIGAMI